MASFYGGLLSPELLDTEHLIRIFMPSFVVQFEQDSEDGILILKNSTSRTNALLTNNSGVLDIQTGF